MCLSEGNEPSKKPWCRSKKGKKTSHRTSKSNTFEQKEESVSLLLSNRCAVAMDSIATCQEIILGHGSSNCQLKWDPPPEHEVKVFIFPERFRIKHLELFQLAKKDATVVRAANA